MADSKGIGRQKAQGQAKQGSKGKNYLFVMGINEYEHAPSLSNAVKDAEDLIAILTSKYQFDPENIVPLFDKKATMPNIYKALIALTAKVTSQDNLIIYFSGHGYFDKGDKTGHLVPVNAKQDAVWEYLSNANLLNRIRAIDSFHTLLIVDSCFSGSLILRKDLDSTALAKTVERFPSRWGLAAGRIEVVEDGIRGDNSPFAKSILSFLKANIAPKFPASELIQHVKRVTPHNGAQTPVGGPLFKVGDVGGEFVFHLRESGAMKWQAAWEKIQTATEKEEWEITHKIMLLHDYVRDFDSADNYEAALELGENLEQRRDFFRAKGSLFKLRKFARKKTVFQEEARQLIEEMEKKEEQARKEMQVQQERDRRQQEEAEKQRLHQEEVKAWEQAKEENTIAAYETYQKTFPTGSNVDEAKKQIIGLKGKEQEVQQAEKEAATWEAASKENIIKAYQAYLKAYPSGKYCAEAEKRIKAIRQKRQKRKSELIKPPSIITETDNSFDTFIDPRDGQAYKTVELNGRIWLAENLNYDVGDGCWVYEKSTGFLGLGKRRIVEGYGRLYTWEAAKKACPPSWRLPTDEEWKSLAKAYGGYYDWSINKSIGNPKKAYQALVQGGNSGFQAVLGGNRYSDGSYSNMGRYGYYWSSTSSDADHVWLYFFHFGKLYRIRSNKSSGKSCRCLKD